MASAFSDLTSHSIQNPLSNSDTVLYLDQNSETCFWSKLGVVILVNKKYQFGTVKENQYLQY